jgi:hypothetical protein
MGPPPPLPCLHLTLFNRPRSFVQEGKGKGLVANTDCRTQACGSPPRFFFRRLAEICNAIPATSAAGSQRGGIGVVEMGLKTARYTRLPVFGVNYIEF